MTQFVKHSETQPLFIFFSRAATRLKSLLVQEARNHEDHRCCIRAITQTRKIISVKESASTLRKLADFQIKEI